MLDLLFILGAVSLMIQLVYVVKLFNKGRVK